MENYKKECAERYCASLCFRLTEASIQHMEEEKSVNKSMILIIRTEHLMQLPVIMSKNNLRFVKMK